MRRDLRPYYIRTWQGACQRWYIRRYLLPAFDRAGKSFQAYSPRNIEIWGPNIVVGDCVQVNASKGNVVRLSTWDNGKRQGRIELGDCVLVSPGTQIIASESIVIGRNTMIASGCYISDSDWHDTYDRTAELDKHAPIVLGENVWLGVRTIVGKGVTIGENSIIGAGSVVTKDIPANTIAAGNPARPIRELDPAKPLRKRSDLFSDPDLLDRQMDYLMKVALKDNTLFGWLRSLIAPTRLD
ncbi:MAG: acyltransferase [Parvibaculaceae bacterium]|nr:acyltransferase [Parvibaculaceae bacterium]